MSRPATSYTVSPELLARPEMREALRKHDFGTAFRLMKKYDGASQDRIASPVEGLDQSRVSKVTTGNDRISSFDLIERIADGLRIPGALLGLAARPWEARELAAAPTSAAPSVARSENPLDSVIHRRLAITIEVDEEGWSRLTYVHELHNAGRRPFTRLPAELWFETTRGPLVIEPVDVGDRNVIIQRVHDTPSIAQFACQIFPALQPGETTTVGFTCEGGRFVYDHYWSQRIHRRVDELTISLAHHGVRQLSRCSATEAHPDGSEVSATDTLTLSRESDGVVILLRRRDLVPGQAVTLRWDVRREPA